MRATPPYPHGYSCNNAPSSRPGESWLSSAWVYDHDPRKRNAFVRPAVPASTPDRYVRRGLASWYGDAFDGKPTASGEPFDSNGGLTRPSILDAARELGIRDAQER